MSLFGVTANATALTTLVFSATKRRRVSKPTILFIILSVTGEGRFTKWPKVGTRRIIDVKADIGIDIDIDADIDIDIDSHIDIDVEVDTNIDIDVDILILTLNICSDLVFASAVSAPTTISMIYGKDILGPYCNFHTVFARY